MPLGAGDRIYAGEAQIAAASAGLPTGWTACLSTSEPREIFFVHIATKATQWERPDAEQADPRDEEQNGVEENGRPVVEAAQRRVPPEDANGFADKNRVLLGHDPRARPVKRALRQA